VAVTASLPPRARFGYKPIAGSEQLKIDRIIKSPLELNTNGIVLPWRTSATSNKDYKRFQGSGDLFLSPARCQPSLK
jgi:hypothetical protein